MSYRYWFLPLILFGCLAPFTPHLDLATSSLFYSPETGFYNNLFFYIMYHYGEIFGLATGALATFFFTLSFLRPRWQKWRKPACAIALTLIIGAGILTNALFKEFWGRPRPKQTEYFGGKHPYRPFWHPNFHSRHNPQKSFPSGHAAMGWYFLSLCFVGKRLKSRPLFNLGIALCLLLGVGLMITRIVQGGHYLSDVLASFVLMWMVSLAIDRLTWGAWGERLLFPKPRDTSVTKDLEKVA